VAAVYRSPVRPDSAATSLSLAVARDSTQGAGRAELPWTLLGVHATQIDVSNRDLEQDERLDLNCAWYADILLTLSRTGGRFGE
jgi:hypothetical protein